VAETMIVNGPARLVECIAWVTALFRKHKHLKLTVTFGKDRTEAQNRLWFSMYKRIGETLDGWDVESARSYCKLHCGVQIMLNTSEAFRDGWYESMVGLSYETKLRLMGNCNLYGPDGFPVTRLFNRQQGIMYTDRIVSEFGPQGVVFDDILSEAS